MSSTGEVSCLSNQDERQQLPAIAQYSEALDNQIGSLLIPVVSQTCNITKRGSTSLMCRKKALQIERKSLRKQRKSLISQLRDEIDQFWNSQKCLDIFFRVKIIQEQANVLNDSLRSQIGKMNRDIYTLNETICGIKAEKKKMRDNTRKCKSQIDDLFAGI
uniref:Uncharacterized protein n=1 Tax=Ditylenchus dipsaci TaxID=166011 RepID=A0A915E794_9BILA